MFISEEVVEKVRLENDIEDVIGSYLPLKKFGSSYRTLCPFHKEKTPSFNVNPGRQSYHCFGCGIGGNVFNFLMRYENVPFPTAVKLLADRVGIPITLSDSTPQKEGEKDRIFKTLERAVLLYHEQLLHSEEGKVAREYLSARGIRPDSIRKFQLGYAPSSWDFTIQSLRSKGFTIEDLDKAGLVVAKQEPSHGSTHYDRFFRRLMFPISNEHGKVVSFSGRVLDPEEKAAKYVNGPSTMVFDKSKNLYNLDKAKRAIFDQKRAFVGEGQLDIITADQSGVANVVAPQGTSFTQYHASLLNRYCSGNEVFVAFDGDEAGISAAMGTIRLVPVLGNMKVLSFPQGEDMDSFIRKGGSLETLARQAVPFPEFYHRETLRKLTTSVPGFDPESMAGRIKVLQEYRDPLANVPDDLLPVYIELIAQQTKVSSDVVKGFVKQRLKRIKAKAEQEAENLSGTNNNNNENNFAIERDNRYKWEKLWLKGLLASGSLETVTSFAELYKPWHIRSPVIRYVFEGVSSLVHEGLDPRAFLQNGASNQLRETIVAEVLTRAKNELLTEEERQTRETDPLDRETLVELLTVTSKDRVPNSRELQNLYLRALTTDLGSELMHARANRTRMTQFSFMDALDAVNNLVEMVRKDVPS